MYYIWKSVNKPMQKITVNDVEIETVTETKFLGLTIDNG